MKLNLSVGAKVKIAPKEASNYHKEGTVIGRSTEGDWVIDVEPREPVLSVKKIALRLPGLIRMRLGRWWVISAIAGKVPYIPIVNC